MPQIDKKHRQQLPPPAEPVYAKIGIIDGPVQKVWPDQLTGVAVQAAGGCHSTENITHCRGLASLCNPSLPPELLCTQQELAVQFPETNIEVSVVSNQKVLQQCKGLSSMTLPHMSRSLTPLLMLVAQCAQASDSSCWPYLQFLTSKNLR